MDARVTALFERRIAVLELAGRNGVNPMDEKFVREFDTAADVISHAVRDHLSDVVVIRSRGRHFSVGGDLSELADAVDPGADVRRMTGFAHRGIAALHALEVPVIAAWQGAAAGGGIGIILAADIVYVGRSATMTAGYSAVGLSPDAGVSWGLSRRLGPERALEMLMSNRRLDADAIVASGLAAEVVDDDHLEERTMALAARIVEVGTSVVRTTKRLVRQASAVDLEAQLRAEVDGIVDAARQERFTAAVAAYAGGKSADRS